MLDYLRQDEKQTTKRDHKRKMTIKKQRNADISLYVVLKIY